VATIHDVAKIAGVSIATVSRVLNKKGKYSRQTEQRVLQAVDKLNFSANKTARSLKTGIRGSVGTVMHEYHIIHNPQLLRSIITSAASMGFNVEILLNKKMCECVPLIMESRYDGLLIIDSDGDEKSLKSMVDRRNNVVFLGGDITREDVNLVEIDFFQGGYIGTKMLIQSGHRDILFIGDDPTLYFTQEIKRGYLLALDEHGMQFNKELIIAGQPYQPGELLGYSTLFDIFNRYYFTAVITTDADIALGVLKAAEKKGIKIPDEVSLLSFGDNEKTAYFIPSLTTIDIPYRQMGELATQILVNSIKKKDTIVKQVKLKVQLSERDSVSRKKLTNR